MRTLRDEVLNLGIPVVDFTSAVELILEGRKRPGAGAVLHEHGDRRATPLHAQRPLSSQPAAQEECITRASRPPTTTVQPQTDWYLVTEQAQSLLYQDSIQYHPTGAIYPSQILGALVTEKVRSVGAQLVNANGEAYIHPLETRDVNASGVIRECQEGRGVEVPRRT